MGGAERSVLAVPVEAELGVLVDDRGQAADAVDGLPRHADVAQRDADVGQGEALAVRAEHRPLAADAPDCAEVFQVLGVLHAAAFHEHAVAVGRGGVVVDLHRAGLVPPAAAQRDRADVPGELAIGRRALVVHRRHPDAIGQRQPLLRLVLDHVHAHLQLQARYGEQLTARPRGAQAALLRGDLRLVPDPLVVGDGWRDELLVVAVLRQEAHRLVGMVGSGHQRATEEVAVAVLDAVLLEVVERVQRAVQVALLRGVGERHGARRVVVRAAAAEHLHVVALALDLEVAVGRLQPLRVALTEVDAALEEQVLRGRIGHRAAAAQADAAPVAVVGDAAVEVGGGDQQVVRTLLQRVGAAHLPAAAVARALGLQAGAERGLAAFLVRHLGDVVDDAAGRADAFGGGRAVDDLDAADDAHVGEGGLARAVAQRRALRDAVEQAQRNAAAQRLAAAAHHLRGFRVARHGARQHGGGVLGHGQGLLDLLLGHHGDRAGDLVHRLGAARAGDDDLAQLGGPLLRRLRFVVGGRGCLVLARRSPVTRARGNLGGRIGGEGVDQQDAAYCYAKWFDHGLSRDGSGGRE